jgi:hypothetical protein
MRISNERGAALITALLATMLLTALGMAVVLVSTTETMITGNYNTSAETLYAADAAIERTVQDLLMAPRWDDLLAGGAVGVAAISKETSSFTEGSATDLIKLPGGGQAKLCCGSDSLGYQMQVETNTEDIWGANNPTWRLYAWGPVQSLLPTSTIDSKEYVAVWVADDPSEGVASGEAVPNPLKDTNGVLTLRAEAFGPSGAHKVVEVTVARTSGTEIERGQIAQRGQEELNQRARKAAVQTPGKSLTRMDMNTGSGGLVVR